MRASLAAQTVRNLPAMWVQSLAGKIPRERNATHSSVIAWRISCIKEPGELLVHRVAKR